MATNGTTPLEQWNLLGDMAPYFDRHLLFPLLNHRGDTPEVQKAKFELFKDTNMIDFVADIDADLKGLKEPAPEWQTKKEEVIAKQDKLQDAAAPVTEVFSNPEIISNLRSDKAQNMEYLKEYGVTPESVDALYDLGYFHYNMGNYIDASALLQQYRVLSMDSEKTNSASWGKFASDTLSTEWEDAMGEIKTIQEQSIDTRQFSNPLAQLDSRTWLIHWALFPLFNHEASRDQILDMFLSPAYINTIQTSCPWILRYLTASIITNRSRTRNSNSYQKQLKELIRVIKAEAYEYSDPFTSFVKALYIDFDFEDSQQRLVEAETLFDDDFFLAASKSEFMDSARHLISESYCKIHQRIDIKDLSTRLGLSQDEGEKWIVNLIRDTRVDAKIDYQAGTVVMNHPPQSVYQQVIERTKGGFFRTQVLNAAVGR